jgi:hypothetical protein
MKRTSIVLASGFACLAAIGCCGGDDPCDPAANTGCDDGLVCETVESGDPACFQPVLVRGDVFDLGDDGAIVAARVVALDVDHAAASDVGVSDVDGRYELRIPSSRDADGAPIGIEVTLRADADGYQSFPGGVRRAIAVDTSSAVADGDGPWVLDGSQTDVGLAALPAGSGTASITGHVELPDGLGALVVAEGGAVGHDAVVGRDGSFAILNLEADDYTVSAYAPGLVHETAEVTLAGGETADVTLDLLGDAGGAISGTVQFVNASGLSTTSVVVFVESTFDATLMSGAAPPAMDLPGVTGSFTFEGVPPGRYVILAAFPDDQLVRDPDSCTSGTDIVHIEVADAPVDAPYSFKITEALSMISPAPGAVVADGIPTFSWVDDSSEDPYQIAVHDSFGAPVWSAEIPGASGADPSVTYDGASPLPGGLYYQVRVTSLRQGGTCEISTTEDLAGVFYVP